MKQFSGSKPSSFYGEGYYLRGEGSNYGRKDLGGRNLFFSTYEEQNIFPADRDFAKFILSNYKPSSALVLGCARAYLVKALREKGVDAKGIDISEWAIANAPQEIKKHLSLGDICDLSQFKDGEFDCVTALDVFEHIAIPDLYTALNEASRVCARTLIVKLPLGKDDLHPDQTNGNDKSHVSVYSESFWVRQFIQRNFHFDGKSTYVDYDGILNGTMFFSKYVSLTTLTR